MTSRDLEQLLVDQGGAADCHAVRAQPRQRQLHLVCLRDLLLAQDLGQVLGERRHLDGEEAAEDDSPCVQQVDGGSDAPSQPVHPPADGSPGRRVVSRGVLEHFIHRRCRAAGVVVIAEERSLAGDGLEAAHATAPAPRPGGVEADVPDLARPAAGAAIQAAVRDQAAADADVEHQVEQVGAVRGFPEVQLGQRGGVRVVVQANGDAQCLLEHALEVDVAPSQLRQPEHHPVLVEHARYGHPETLDRSGGIAGLAYRPLRQAGEPGDHRVDVRIALDGLAEPHEFPCVKAQRHHGDMVIAQLGTEERGASRVEAKPRAGPAAAGMNNRAAVLGDEPSFEEGSRQL